MKKVGAGTVEKRGKDCWRIRISVVHDDGTPERLGRTVHCRTKTEAKQILDAWRTELMTQGDDIRRKGMTVREYLLEHVVYCRDVEQLSPTTVRGIETSSTPVSLASSERFRSWSLSRIWSRSIMLSCARMAAWGASPFLARPLLRRQAS